MSQKRIIGLTGGIATGKTTVANYLAQAYQLPVLDADIYAREAVDIGSPVLGRIIQRYGKDILLKDNDGSLNRSKLGKIIFRDKQERLWLEGEIHPYVRNCFVKGLQQYLNQPKVVLVIPLLIEAKMTDLVTEIWVVACSEEEQLRRLMERDAKGDSFPRLSSEESRARINTQIPLAKKIALADIVLDNNLNQEYLIQQIDVAVSQKANS